MKIWKSVATNPDFLLFNSNFQKNYLYYIKIMKKINIIFIALVVMTLTIYSNQKAHVKLFKPSATSLVKDSLLDVSTKQAVFIGDSHTSNYISGWQVLVCKQTKMKMTNLSVIGKTTEWMLAIAKLRLSSNYDYCFIYGGANDMYSNSISINQALTNIKQIIKLCKIYNITPIILTGFDPIKCTKTNNPNYGIKYAKFQQALLDSFKPVKVIDTRVIDRTSCWDNLCHMNSNGHKKTAKAVIDQCKFKIW